MPPWVITPEGLSEVQSTAATIIRRACRGYTCPSRPARALVQSGSVVGVQKQRGVFVLIHESGMVARNTEKPRTGP